MTVVKSDSAKVGKTPAKSKKAVAVTAAKILRVQDFAEKFNIAKSVVLKLIEDAKIEVVFAQPSGRGFINLYSVEQVEPLLKKYLEDKAIADAERLKLESEKAARKQKKSDNKGQQELPLQVNTVFDPAVLDPIKQQMTDMTSVIHRYQDTNSKQFELLTVQMKMLEKQLSSVYDLVSSLENAFLAVHTAPATPPETTPGPAPSPEPVKTEEANKAQQFFQDSSKSSASEAVTTIDKTLHLSKTKTTAGGDSAKTGVASDVVGKVVGKTSGDSKSGSKDAKSSSTKPRVLIIGLHDNKVRHFNDFQNIMDLTIINPDNATMMSTKTFPKANYTVFMIDFVAHSACTQTAQGSEQILVRGSNTKLRHTLANIALKHNLQ